MMMKTIQEIDSDFICDIQAPCFQELPMEAVDLIRASKTQVFFRKGENLTKQGTFASYILFILKGVARQYVEGNGTKNYNLRVVQPGAFLGLSLIYKGNKVDYSTVALTDCQAFLIEKETLRKIVRTNATFGYSLAVRYHEQNANLYDSFRKVLYKQMNGRMADALLYLNEIKTVVPGIFPMLSRKDLADFAAITPENAVKLLKNFEKEGLLALDDKDITLLNLEVLQEISKRG
jgi:CRP-like cAMP-binding protein